MIENLSSKVRKLHVWTNKLVESMFAGNYHSVFKGHGLEFDEVREYQYGDDVRFIDWNVSSRMSWPYTKTFKEERELTLFVVVDVSPSLNLGNGSIDKRDLAGTVFAVLSLAAVANNDKVGSLLFTDKVEKLVPPDKGRRHALRQISDVLGYKAQGCGSKLELALRATSQTLKRKSIVVIISDFRLAGYGSAINLLAHKHDVIAIRVTDALDERFPSTGLAEFCDPESGDTITVWVPSARIQHDYAEFWQENRLDWINTCRAAGVDTLEIDTDDDPAMSLHKFFKRRRGR